MKFDIELFKATGSLEGDEARTAFAAALRVPINEEIAKRNLARTIFMVDNIGPGANATYPIDIPEISAYILPRIGAAPQNLVAVEELNVPTFEVTSSVEWKLRLAREGRINIIERKALSLRNSIVKLENQCAWQMVNAAVTADNTVEGANDGKLTKGALNAGFQHMESMDGYKVDLILVSARKAGDIREWSANDLDPVTMREVWRGAGLGNIWGADILVTNEIGDDAVYFFDTSKFGVMPIKHEFITYDDPTAIRQFRQRVLGFEEIGFAVFDAKAVVKVELSKVDT